MAGDEEPAHYLIARHAPAMPELFLSLVGRPLVTLALALPAQAGFLAARLVSALASGACAYSVARIARAAGLGSPLAAVLFLLVQPFYLAHSGTVMTEPWAAALLAGMLLAFTERRGRLLVLLAALAPLARLETMLFWPFAAWVLVREGPRRWLAALPIPIIAWNAIGAWTSGDPLWLLHQSRLQTYPEREFFHYVRSFVWIVGLGLFPAMVTGLVRAAVPMLGFGRGRTPTVAEVGKTRGRSRTVAKAGEARARALTGSTVSALVLLAAYSALAALYPVTFGNLRYLAYAAPALAILAAGGVHALLSPDRTRNPADAVGPALAVLGAVLWWRHPLLRDFAVLTRVDYLPLVAATGWLGLFLARDLAHVRRWAAVLPLLLVAANVGDLALRHRATLHLAPLPEQAAVRRAAKALPARLPAGARLLAAHPVLALYRGVNPYDPAAWPPLTDRIAAVSPPGTVFFWDTHYALGKNPSLELLPILQSKNWGYGAGFVAADSSWAGVYLVRSGPGDEAVLAALGPGLEEKTWLRAARLIQYGIPDGRENVRADPGNDEYWRVFAQRLMYAGFTAEAWSALDRASRLDPKDARNAAYRAEFHRNRKEYAEATQAAAEAVAGDPDNPTFRYLAGMILLDQSRLKEAAPHLLAAAHGLPKRWDTQYAAGVVLFDLGRYAEAEHLLAAAARLNPNDWQPVLQLAKISWRQDRKEEAIERVRAFSARRPETSQPYAFLADLFTDMGRAEDARAVLEEGMKKTGGDPEIASRLQSAAPPTGP
jgi:tetratricopeptide (TPR) repeat protein